MKKIVLALILTVIAARPAAASSGLILNEIMYALPGSDAGREWLELKNVGASPVTLIGGRSKDAWRLVISSTQSQETYLFATQALSGSLTVQPGGFLIIAVDAPTFLAEHPTFSGSVVDCCGQSTAIQPLKDSGALVQIKNGSGEIISEVYYSNSMGAWENGKTLEFDGKTWREGLRDGGTPGQENSVVGLVLPEASPMPTPPRNLALSSSPQFTPKNSAETFKDLVISEFLPNPKGNDLEGEWIEIANLGRETVDLAGAALATDASKKPYALSGTLAPSGYLVIRRQESGLILRNTGGKIQLLDENASPFFEISYGDGIPEGWAAARFQDGIWKITETPTPGKANILASQPQPDQKQAPLTEKSSSGLPGRERPISGHLGTGMPTGAVLAAGLALGVVAASIVVFLKRKAVNPTE